MSSAAMSDAEEMIRQGRQLLQQGRLMDAANVCRQVLQKEPNSAEALHMLGLVSGRMGNLDMAAKLIGCAISLNGSSAEYHSDLATAFRNLGRGKEAESAARQALRL